MENQEIAHIFAAILVLFVVGSFSFVFKGNTTMLAATFIFAFLIIGLDVCCKKIIALMLDASVRHKVWHFYRFGLKPGWHFKKPVPFGVIIPLVFSVFSLGLIKIMSLLTYETSALKQRAAKRFGFYSYTEMTDWHNGLIGAAGILGVLVLSLLGYLLGFEYLTKLAAYYAFWNMLPISDLDGTQIFFGSRILWTVLGIITLIFTAYALML